MAKVTRNKRYEHGVHQAPVHNITAKELLRSAAFMRGFREVQAGKPMDYDAFQGRPNDQWNYERGRILATVWDGPVKIGQKITMSALYALRDALVSKEMI